MTGPVTWPSTDIHTMFGPNLAPPLGIDWKFITAFAQFALESFIGQVAIAFGGIDIFGWKPLDFLAEWGQDRVDEATANFIAATNAGNSAVNANNGVQAIKAQLAGVAAGGTYFTDELNYANAATLPIPPGSSTYELNNVGAGAGSFGPNGSGKLVWKPVGSGSRDSWYRSPPNVLTTDNGVISIVVSGIPQSGGAGIILAGRQDSSGNCYAMARIERTAVRIGYQSYNGAFGQIASATIAAAPGDVYEFYFGDSTDVDHLWVVRNSLTVLDTTGSAGSGPTTRMCGIGAHVTPATFFGQLDPGIVDAWTCADQDL